MASRKALRPTPSERMSMKVLCGALLGSLPVAIFYSFFVEHYVSSLTGAVKE